MSRSLQNDYVHSLHVVLITVAYYHSPYEGTPDAFLGAFVSPDYDISILAV